MMKGSVADYAHRGCLAEALQVIPRSKWTHADSEGNSLLHYACRGKNRAAAALLLAYGLDANARNVYGDMPLHVAARSNVADAVDLLIAAGASVRMLNRQLESPLDVASAEWVDGSVRFSLVRENARLIGSQNDQAQAAAEEEVVLQCRADCVALLYCVKKKSTDGELARRVALELWTMRGSVDWWYAINPPPPPLSAEQVEASQREFDAFVAQMNRPAL